MPEIRAAIFDIGGVLTTSPVQQIRVYERLAGLPPLSLGDIMGHPEGPWSRFERSDISREEFIVAFEREAAARGLEVDGTEFLRTFFEGMGPRHEMLAVVRSLRGRLALGCITNNVISTGDRSPGHGAFTVDELFDVVIESSKVGVRKPDPRIYQMTCDALGVGPAESVFLDDFGVNLKAARAMGMTTIKVDETHGAIDELEAVLGWQLPRPPGRGSP